MVNDYFHLPIHNSRILGITSLWVLIPIIYGNNYYLLRSSLFSCCFFSTLLWYKPINNSIYHILDVYSAYIYIIFLLYTSYKLLKFKIICLLLSNIIIFYSLSCYYYTNFNYIYQLINHLLFRYVCYIWSHTILFLDYNMFIISLGYLLHIYITYNYCNLENDELYLIFCIYTCIFIYFTYYIHFIFYFKYKKIINKYLKIN